MARALTARARVKTAEDAAWLSTLTEGERVIEHLRRALRDQLWGSILTAAYLTARRDGPRDAITR